MPTAFPLQTLLDLMQSRTDTAAVELGRRIAREKDARAQLQMLEDYRREYGDRFNASARAGMTPGQWQNFQEFMGRLDEAIGHQRKVVDGNSRETLAGQKAWVEQKNRLRAFDTLADRHYEKERIRDGRRDQKATDELSARRVLGDFGADK